MATPSVALEQMVIPSAAHDKICDGVLGTRIPFMQIHVITGKAMDTNKVNYMFYFICELPQGRVVAVARKTRHPTHFFAKPQRIKPIFA